MGCNMSLKIHFLDSHLNFVPSNCGSVSDEQSEQFHHDISSFEKWYEGKGSTDILADNCWTMTRDIPLMSTSDKPKTVE